VTLMQHALALAARGLSVIAVPAPQPGAPPGQPGDGKVPRIRWAEFQQRPATEDEIRAWWTDEPDANPAIVTGAVSDLVVVDADSPEALRHCTRTLKYTPWQVQTGRGYHLYYRHPGVQVRNRAHIETKDGQLAIDVRADGGFVIAPGARHASGAQYLEAGDWSVPRNQLPRFWPGWLSRPTTRPRPSTPPVARQTGDLIDRARRYLAAIPAPAIGQGSDNATLYAACRLTRGFGISEADAAALLWEWAGNRPGWTYAWVEEKVSHAVRYGTEPIGALR
jgi:hypothetical protein